MEKRIILLIVGLLFMISGTVYADDFISAEIECIDAEMPEINTYLSFFDSDGNRVGIENFDDIDVMLEGDILEVEGIKAIKDSELGIAYIFAVDISGSANYGFEDIKSSLKMWALNMQEDDQMVLVTFGESVKVVLEGTEDEDTRVEVIENLNANEKGTMFFDGIYKALSIAESDSTSLSDMRVLITITDGRDYSEGGVTSNELKEKLTSSSIQMYSIATENAVSNDISQMGELSRSTNANVLPLSGNVTADVFLKLKRDIEKVYVLTSKGETNIISGEVQTLSITIQADGQIYEAADEVRITRYVPDETYPTIVSITAIENDVIEIVFSEDVIGADSISNYSLVDAEGQEVLLSESEYSNNTANLTLTNNIYDGDYIINLSNIHDISMEENEIEKAEYEFQVTDFPKPVIEEIEEGTNWLLIFALAAFGIIIIVVLVIIIKKRKKSDDENYNSNEQPSSDSAGVQNSVNEKHHVKKEDGKKALFVAVSEKGAERNIDVFISDEIYIGRSLDCEISFDDSEMSRRHCRIMYQDGMLYVEDLASTNGTLLNGVPLKTPMLISVDDVIEAGSHKIVYAE